LGDVYRILTRNSGEYFLLEARIAQSYDQKMPASGLAVLHIDEKAALYTEGWPGQSGWPQNGNHYRVAVLQADGNYDLERGRNRGDGGDLYTQGKAVGPGTTPSTDTYQRGNVGATGIEVRVLSVSGTTVQFSLTLPESASTSITTSSTSTLNTSFTISTSISSSSSASTSTSTLTSGTSSSSSTSTLTSSASTPTLSWTSAPTVTTTITTDLPKLRVQNILLKQVTKSNTTYVRALVFVADQNMDPIADVLVQGTFRTDNLIYEKTSSTTDVGVARFVSLPKNPSSPASFCIKNILKSDHVYLESPDQQCRNVSVAQKL
jgi:hypothetical protein